MNRSKYRKSWLRAHKGYERRAYSILRKYFRDSASKVPFMFLDNENYIDTINNSITIGNLYEAYYNLYNVIGMIHGKRIGNGINRDIKDFNPIVFESEYQRRLYEWIIDNLGYRIVSVREEYVKYIQKLVFDSFNEGLTPSQLATNIQKIIGRRDFYRWQALRIARTESALAANRAASIAGRTSGIVLEKEWISVNDARTRLTPFDHRDMDGVKVSENDYFNVNGEFILYPSAQTTKSGSRSSGSNVINCRCTVALVPKRDPNGRIMRI